MAKRPKFNEYILNIKGPIKVGQVPKLGPGAHALDNPDLRKEELTIENNILLWGLRVVVPQTLRLTVSTFYMTRTSEWFE